MAGPEPRGDLGRDQKKEKRVIDSLALESINALLPELSSFVEMVEPGRITNVAKRYRIKVDRDAMSEFIQERR